MGIIEEFIRESNAIEGETSDEAFEDALAAWQYLETKDKVPVQEVLSVHKILMRRLRPDIAGRWRQCDVRVGGRRKRFIDEDVIIEQIRHVCDLMNDKPLLPGSEYADGVTKAAHIGFENIHPFEDGNGRTGRLLYNWHRTRLGLPIHVIHVGPEQADYYKWFN